MRHSAPHKGVLTALAVQLIAADPQPHGGLATAALFT